MYRKKRLALCVAVIVTPALFAAGCSSSPSKHDEYRIAPVNQEQAPQPIDMQTSTPTPAEQGDEVVAQLPLFDIPPYSADETANSIELSLEEAPSETDPGNPQLDLALADEGELDADREESLARPGLTLFRFGFDQTELSEQDREIIVQHGQFLANHPEKKIQLHGHADAQGDPVYNRHLATLRANHVAKLLKEQGVGDAQIEIFSWGSDKPLAVTSQWRDNRRVELFYEESLMVEATSEPAEDTTL